MSTPRHWPALDGLRGIAILLVLPHNIDAFNSSNRWEWLPAVVSHSGWIGVQIFFVLSGFLITSQLLDSLRSRNYFSAFYMRRILRIFPLYYLTLALVVVAVPHFVHLSPRELATLDQQRWLWLFLNNWTQPFHGAIYLLPHFWSLAVEEQFYLFWPVVILAAPGGPRLLGLCGALICAALAARTLCLIWDLPVDAPYMFTICRMDALAMGAAGAALLHWRQDLMARGKVATVLWVAAIVCFAAGAVITHAFDVHGRMTTLIGYPLLALVTIVLILICTERRRQILPDLTYAALSFGALRSVGRYSYAMYVLHLPLLILAGPSIRSWLVSLGLTSSFWYVGIIVAITYFLAIASYHLIERQFLVLKKHFRPRYA